ncbi:MAG: FkbM family methyltransferase [Nitriliruptor sp.]|uniref:FkbM family methyltransferase n=1 Tax=Nitriliruptor sp. TaxID=2448056 RepID=UPI0034A056A4
MTAQDDVGEVSEVEATVTPQARAHLLAAYDLALLANAPNYDLREPDERARSVRDLERLFFRAVRLLQPEVFIEAGAKDATASRRARRYLPDARIVAFEANPYVHDRFRERNEEPKHRMEYRHLALSDTVGEVTFNVMRGADGRPLANGKGSLKDLVQHEYGTQQVTVPSTTLDRFFAEHRGSPTVMWVDVEGATEQVLGGGKELLADVQLIFIEVEDRDRWVWGPAWTMNDVSAFLLGHGLIPVGRDYQSRFQYNVLFARPEVLLDHRFRPALTLHRSGAYRTEPPPPPPPPPPPETTLRRLRRVAGRVKRRLRAATRRAPATR